MGSLVRRLDARFPARPERERHLRRGQAGDRVSHGRGPADAERRLRRRRAHLGKRPAPRLALPGQRMGIHGPHGLTAASPVSVIPPEDLSGSSWTANALRCSCSTPHSEQTGMYSMAARPVASGFSRAISQPPYRALMFPACAGPACAAAFGSPSSQGYPRVPGATAFASGASRASLGPFPVCRKNPPHLTRCGLARVSGLPLRPRGTTALGRSRSRAGRFGGFARSR